MADSQQVNRTQTSAGVVTLPAEIDITDTRQLGGELASALTSGAAVVVADMTATMYCDSSWARILVLAGRQAAATGIKLRLAAPSSTVQHTLALLGVDGLLPLYPTLDAALATTA